MRRNAARTALPLAIASSFASCIISPKDYPLETSSLGGEASGGEPGSVGAGGKHKPSDGGTPSSEGGEPPITGDAGSQTHAGSSNGGSSTLGGTGGSAPEAGTSSGGTSSAGTGGVAGAGGVAGSGGQLGNGGTAGAGGGGNVDPACAGHPLSARATWLASASSSSLGNEMEADGLYNPPEHMIDGNFSERWASGKTQAGDEWIQIDFGKTVALSSVTLAVGNDTGDYPRAYALRVSAAAQDFAAPVLASGNGKVGDNTITLAKVATGRYLTIKQTASVVNGPWWAISELTVSCGATQPAGCGALPTWETKSYALGDQVRSTCGGVFASPCTAGQQHTFECNPQLGQAAVVWCQQREPGVSNGWADAWIDKGQCP